MDTKVHDIVSPKSLFEASGARALLDQLDAELIGLVPVKSRPCKTSATRMNACDSG